MPPKSYYEIKEETFLFRKYKTPEESIRQWLLFELMMTYGYSINQIKIEVPVKYGTKTGYADIVIYKENLPFIVIECKKPEDEKFKQHLAQAKSYAAGLGIKAEYSVYSNGDDWIVRRLINNQWEYCLDIPNVKEVNQGRDFRETFEVYDYIRRLLYWRYKHIPHAEAESFLMLISTFFMFKSKSSEVTKGTNEKLLMGIDRLISCIYFSYDNNIFKAEKLYYSYRYFIEYHFNENVEDIDLPLFKYKEVFCIDDIKSMNYTLLSAFENQIFITSKGICNLDTNIIRFLIALLHHVERQLEEPDKIIELDGNIANEFFNYLELALKLNLNIDLPDRLHKEKIKELDRLCEKDWLKVKTT